MLYVYICYIVLYNLARMLVVCYQYKTFVNIGTFKGIIDDLNCTKVVFFSNYCTANLSLVQLNIPV